MKRFEFVEHTADIAIRAYGKDVNEAFASAADAMFAIITDEAEIRPIEKREIRIESDSFNSLLVKFLSELIVIHEVERVVLSDFEVKISQSKVLEATARGESFDDTKHAQGHHVKGVSYHMLDVHFGTAGEETFVQVLFDV